MNSEQPKYYVAHARGVDFVDLQRKGFLTFHPMMDDYVFLKVSEDNKQWLSKQEELRVKFLRQGREYTTVTEASLEGLYRSTVSKVQEGSEVTVVVGYCEGLSGVVTKREGDQLVCDLVGYRRHFVVDVGLNQVVSKGIEVVSNLDEPVDTDPIS